MVIALKKWLVSLITRLPPVKNVTKSWEKAGDEWLEILVVKLTNTCSTDINK